MLRWACAHIQCITLFLFRMPFLIHIGLLLIVCSLMTYWMWLIADYSSEKLAVHWQNFTTMASLCFDNVVVICWTAAWWQLYFLLFIKCDTRNNFVCLWWHTFNPFLTGSCCGIYKELNRSVISSHAVWAFLFCLYIFFPKINTLLDIIFFSMILVLSGALL